MPAYSMDELARILGEQELRDYQRAGRDADFAELYNIADRHFNAGSTANAQRLQNDAAFRQALMEDMGALAPAAIAAGAIAGASMFPNTDIAFPDDDAFTLDMKNEAEFGGDPIRSASPLDDITSYLPSVEVDTSMPEMVSPLQPYDPMDDIGYDEYDMVPMGRPVIMRGASDPELRSIGSTEAMEEAMGLQRLAPYPANADDSMQAMMSMLPEFEAPTPPYPDMRLMVTPHHLLYPPASPPDPTRMLPKLPRTSDAEMAHMEDMQAGSYTGAPYRPDMGEFGPRVRGFNDSQMKDYATYYNTMRPTQDEMDAGFSEVDPLASIKARLRVLGVDDATLRTLQPRQLGQYAKLLSQHPLEEGVPNMSTRQNPHVLKGTYR